MPSSAFKENGDHRNIPILTHSFPTRRSSEQSNQGPASDDAHQDERRQASAGTRHEGRPQDDPLGRRTTDDVRVEVARFLGPAAFPGEPEKLRSTATDNQATQEVRDLLSELPERTYESVQEVLDSLGLDSL